MSSDINQHNLWYLRERFYVIMRIRTRVLNAEQEYPGNLGDLEEGLREERHLVRNLHDDYGARLAGLNCPDIYYTLYQFAYDLKTALTSCITAITARRRFDQLRETPPPY